MSITLDTTVAGASSNAYADTTFYDSYFETNLIFTPVWLALTSDQKKARIVQATKSVDVLTPDFTGVPYTYTQNLEFPRDICDYRYPASSVHRRVKEAVGEMIVYQYYKQDATGAIDAKEISKIAAVSGLVDVEYFEKNDSSSADLAAGGSLERVRGLLSVWLGSKTLQRF